MLLELAMQQLTYELLITLISEVVAIVNARPITAVPSDINEPLLLTPAMLLMQKACFPQPDEDGERFSS